MFKILLSNCCGLDVHKTWIFACIGITDKNNRTVYHEARFPAFSKGLRELSEWLRKYNCVDVCMESAGKYWIPVFNILEKSCRVTLAHPKYRRIKARRGHKKAIIAICRMLLTAIWNVLAKGIPYSPDGFSVLQPSFVSKPLSKSQGLALLRQMGYLIKDDSPVPA